MIQYLLPKIIYDVVIHLLKRRQARNEIRALRIGLLSIRDDTSLTDSIRTNLTLSMLKKIHELEAHYGKDS